MSRIICQFTAAVVISVLAQFLSAIPGNAEVIREDNCDLAKQCGVSAYVWRQESSPPRAIVVIVHGFTHQGLSVEELAEQLAGDGYLVFSLEQRGHGRWFFDSQLGRDGSTGESRTERTLDYAASINDLQHLIECARTRYPGMTVYCVGESSGSAIIAQAARRPNSGIDGMVLTSAGARPRALNPVWVMSDFLSNVYRLNHAISLRRYMSAYASNEPRVIDEMIDDQLCRKDMSGMELIHTVEFISHTTSSLKHVPSQVPLLVLQGKKDHLLQQSTVRSMFRGAKSTDKSIVYYPEYGHVLIGTQFIHADVAQKIRSWLDKRCSKSLLTASGEH
jgi:alpha-beta hydrolase superfamily lysophospholipase